MCEAQRASVVCPLGQDHPPRETMSHSNTGAGLVRAEGTGLRASGLGLGMGQETSS